MKMFELLPRPIGSIFRKLTRLTCNSRNDMDSVRPTRYVSSPDYTILPPSSVKPIPSTCAAPRGGTLFFHHHSLCSTNGVCPISHLIDCCPAGRATQHSSFVRRSQWRRKNLVRGALLPRIAPALRRRDRPSRGTDGKAPASWAGDPLTDRAKGRACALRRRSAPSRAADASDHGTPPATTPPSSRRWPRWHSRTPFQAGS